jgi:hypothetical protein
LGFLPQLCNGCGGEAFEVIVAVGAQSVVDDSFLNQKLIDLEQAVDVSPEDSAAGDEGEVTIGVAPVCIHHEIPVGLIKFRVFVPSS